MSKSETLQLIRATAEAGASTKKDNPKRQRERFAAIAAEAAAALGKSKT